MKIDLSLRLSIPLPVKLLLRDIEVEKGIRSGSDLSIGVVDRSRCLCILGVALRWLKEGIVSGWESGSSF